MKNKTKKILAGLGLGLVGMGCLTGCSMNDEQLSAINGITEKADNIIELLEQNVNYNNNQLSKAEAAEKILLGRNNWKLMNFNELEFTIKQVQYDGLFDKATASYTSDFDTPFRWLYRSKDNTKVFAKGEGTQIEGITVSDFAEDEHKIWRAQTDTTLVDREYDTEDFILQLDILGQIGISTIGADDVKDIKVTETGYEFKVLMGEDNEYTTTTQEVVFNVSKEGYITSFTAKVLLYTKSTDKYESLLAECTYKYSGVDFTALDAKIASLTPSA